MVLLKQQLLELTPPIKKPSFEAWTTTCHRPFATLPRILEALVFNFFNIILEMHFPSMNELGQTMFSSSGYASRGFSV